MLLCTGPDISCNLLHSYTAHCVMVNAGLLPANAWSVTTCQVTCIACSLHPTVSTFASHQAKAVHKAWGMTKTASVLSQTNKLQLPECRCGQSILPQERTSCPPAAAHLKALIPVAKILWKVLLQIRCNSAYCYCMRFCTECRVLHHQFQV